MLEDISNDDLRPEHLPVPQAAWHDVSAFALRYPGGARWPDAYACGDVANETKKQFRETGGLPDDLDVLRCCLAFEQRRWRHFGEAPNEGALPYIHGLVEAIRNLVQKH